MGLMRNFGKFAQGMAIGLPGATGKVVDAIEDKRERRRDLVTTQYGAATDAAGRQAAIDQANQWGLKDTATALGGQNQATIGAFNRQLDPKLGQVAAGWDAYQNPLTPEQATNAITEGERRLKELEGIGTLGVQQTGAMSPQITGAVEKIKGEIQMLRAKKKQLDEDDRNAKTAETVALGLLDNGVNAGLTNFEEMLGMVRVSPQQRQELNRSLVAMVQQAEAKARAKQLTKSDQKIYALISKAMNENATPETIRTIAGLIDEDDEELGQFRVALFNRAAVKELDEASAGDGLPKDEARLYYKIRQDMAIYPDQYGLGGGSVTEEQIEQKMFEKGIMTPRRWAEKHIQTSDVGQAVKWIEEQAGYFTDPARQANAALSAFKKMIEHSSAITTPAEEFELRQALQRSAKVGQFFGGQQQQQPQQPQQSGFQPFWMPQQQQPSIFQTQG